MKRTKQDYKTQIKEHISFLKRLLKKDVPNKGIINSLHSEWVLKLKTL